MSYEADVVIADTSKKLAEQLALALKAGRSGTFNWDARSNRNVWSAELLDLYGMTAEQFGGRLEDWEAALVPEDRERGNAAVAKSLEGGDFVCEFRIRRRDNGEVRWMHGRGQMMFDAGGKPERMVGINVDITELRKTEAVLREVAEKFAKQSRLFEQIAGATPDFIYVFDLSGRFLYANRRLLEVWGRSFEDAVGKSLYELGYPEWHADMHMREIAEVISTRRPVKGEVPFTGGSGISGVYEYIFTPVLGPDGAVEVIAGTTRDVTERHRVEEELLAAKQAAECAQQAAELARQKAEEASGAKDHFLAALSHELRTPLTPVLASAQMLEKEEGLSGEHRETVQLIRRNVELEARLIDDLLDLTRIARNKLHLHLEEVDVHEKVRQVVGICAEEITAKGLDVVMRLGAMRHHVEADPTRLQQILWNLVKNAVKFTPAGGRVTIQTSEVGGAEGGRLLMEVMDTGIGVPAENLPRIFDAFEQGDREVTRRFGGLGLGLAITKALVELHGGTVAAASEGVGKGSRFSVELALASRKGGAGTAAGKVEKGKGEGVSLVLVEDHADTRAVMLRFLKGMGCEVRVAGSLAEAAQLLRERKPDLLISDIGLPDGSGVELMRHARAMHDLRGIALSGYGMEEDVARSMEAGFVAHLTKPVNLQALMDAIEKLMR